MSLINFELEGKRILVTGAGKGIGRDLTVHLIEVQKSFVIAVSRTKSDLESLLEKYGKDKIKIIPADLKKKEDCFMVAAEAGEVDYLVNNAGCAEMVSFLETSIESFRDIMSINVESVLILSQQIAKGMIKRNWQGAIVNVSSLGSKIGVENHGIYTASKAALDGLSSVMALELGQYGIRVNTVNPTAIMTDMGKKVWSDPEKAKLLLSRIPLGKLVETKDVIESIIFLLTCKMVNASNIMVEGGFLNAPFNCKMK